MSYADDLDRFLDALDLHPPSGVPQGEQTDIRDFAQSIHDYDRVDFSANPRPEFLANLEERLAMNTSTTVQPPPFHPLTGTRLVRPPATKLPPITRVLRHHTIGSFATAALVVVALIGVYVTMFKPNNPGNPTPTFGAFATGSPVAGNTQEDLPCYPTYSGVDFGCLLRADDIGTGYLWPKNFDPESLQARSVQLQGWAILPGKTLTGVEKDSTVTGVVTDFVLSGSYVATFDVPVVVNPGGWTNDPVQYLAAGDPVELGRGATVTYQLGGLVEIHNPLSVERLEFKRAVIYQGDITVFSTVSDGVTTRAEADGTLDPSFDLAQAFLELWYINLKIGQSIPTTQSVKIGAVIGPTDPQRGPAGTEGFVLTIRRGEG